MSVLIGIFILAGAWRVLKEAIHILNEGAPEDADAQEAAWSTAETPNLLVIQ